MSRKMLNGLALTILALAIIKKTVAFVPQGRSARKSKPLFVLPKIIKKGEKVETEVDVVGVLKAAGFFGGDVVALGTAILGPQNGVVSLPNLPSLPSISLPSPPYKSSNAESSATSVTKKTEKKIVKAKKMRSSSDGYDLELDEGLRSAETKKSKTAFDRELVTKEEEEARQAAKAKAKEAIARKEAQLEARKKEAEGRRKKLAKEKAEKDAARAKAKEEEKKGDSAITKATNDDEKKSKVAADNVKEEEKASVMNEHLSSV